MGLYGIENFKSLLLPKLWIFLNKLFLKISRDSLSPRKIYLLTFIIGIYLFKFWI